MTINEIQDEIIDEFSGFDDWMDKYQLLIDLGNEQEPLDDKYKTEQNLIDGCQSRVWLQADRGDGLIHFSAASDALVKRDQEACCSTNAIFSRRSRAKCGWRVPGAGGVRPFGLIRHGMKG